MKKAIGYIRVSTNEQLDKYGVEVQKLAIAKYAEEHGYEIERFLVDDISGVKDNRPQWNVILSETIITNPPYEAVIAFKSDRVARDTKLYFYYLYLLEKRNIKLISVNEDFESMGEFANVIRSMMLFVAEQERKNITIRTSAGRASKATIGGYSGGRVPLGYSVEKNELVVNDKEAKAVKYIFQRNSEGASANQIAEELKRAHIPTKGGGMWRANAIINIIKNKKFYQGFYKYGGSEWVKGKHEALIG